MIRRRKLWMQRGGWVLGILLAFALGLSLQNSSGPVQDAHNHVSTDSADSSTIWTCSMHPQIQLPEPGPCPLCGMDLIPLEGHGDDAKGEATLTLSPRAQKLAQIQTTLVERRQVNREIRLVGKLEEDETRVREITAWVEGRIDKLYIDYTGVAVQQGDKLFDLYSPDLYSAQEELLQALRAEKQLSKSGLASTRRSATRNVLATRDRLRLWGLTKGQISDIIRRDAPSDHVTIVAPMSGVVMHKSAQEGTYVQTGSHVYSIADLSVLWLKMDVYEADLGWVKLGQEVEFETDVYPGEPLTGKVSFIDPMLDERSRSIKVRVNVPNDRGRLKPGMFARAVLRAPIGNDQELPIVVPASAPLVTGTRAIVYVKDPEQPGVYHGREVRLGSRAGDYYVVWEGLQVGEEVVSNGSFKIDSALQILAKKSMMNPTGGGPAPGHQHGGSSTPTPASGQGHSESTAIIPGLPSGFRSQLDAVLAAYFDVGQALSRGELAEAQHAGLRLQNKTDGIETHALTEEAGHEWHRSHASLTGSARALIKAAELEEARGVFLELSSAMIGLVRKFGTSDHSSVYQFHCPMAGSGDGADWLQSNRKTRNPFFGSDMLTCGSITEVLMESNHIEDESSLTPRR